MRLANHSVQGQTCIQQRMPKSSSSDMLDESKESSLLLKNLANNGQNWRCSSKFLERSILGSVAVVRKKYA